MPKALSAVRQSHGSSPAQRPSPLTPAQYWGPILLAAYEADAEEYDALIVTNQAAALEIRICSVLNPAAYPLPNQSQGSFLPWAYTTFGRSPNPRLTRALEARKALKKTERHEVRGLAHNMFIYKSPARYAILIGFAHLGVDRFAVEYPPKNHWVASTHELFEVWESYLENYEQPDPRLPRHPLMKLDPNQLQMSIPSELSCCLYDKKTNELVFIVIRKFANHRAILDWAMQIVHRAAITRKSIRVRGRLAVHSAILTGWVYAQLEDPGSLLQVMYSAGSRRAPSFGMVRNITASLTEEEMSEANRSIASLFSYVWLRAKGLFPPEIIADFVQFYDRYNIPRFDPDWPDSATATGSVELPCALGPVSFDDVERSPGLGVLHDRYAR